MPGKSAKQMVLDRRKTRERLAEERKSKTRRSSIYEPDRMFYNESSSSDDDDEDEVVLEGDNQAKRKSDDKPSQDQAGEAGLRKHPFHKSSWGPYPKIEITKGNAAPIATNPSVKFDKDQRWEAMEKLRKLKYDRDKIKEEGNQQNLDEVRSAGNVSLRNVLARLGGGESSTAYYRNIPISIPWVIKQIAHFGLLWEMVMYCVVVTTLGLISYSAFFSFFETEIWDWIQGADAVFAVDTVIRLAVEIWRYRRRATVIVFTAPYTMLQFFLDIISMIPLHVLYAYLEGLEELSTLSLIDYFRFNRYLRISRSIMFFNSLQRERMVDEKILFLFKFTNYYLGFICVAGCVLVQIIGVEPIDYLLISDMNLLERSFLNRFQIKKPGYGSTPWDIFVITINFATAVVTTVGYGDLTPVGEREMLVCIVLMLVGAIFLNGYFTSQLTNFVVELDGARFDLFFRLQQIRQHLSSISTLPFITAKVEEYYKYLWTYREGVFDVPFMRAFPQTFREELLFDICQEMFDKSQLFYNLDESFLRAIAKIVTVALYNPNMLLSRRGKHANKMYYILQGECQVMSKLNPASASAIIRAGSIIGEANLFFSFPYTTTTETRTCCQFIILHKKELLTVLDSFPTEMEILRSRSMNKIKELYETHQAYGIDPVCWVKAKTDMDNPSNPNADKLRRNMRWAVGLNKAVVEDVIDDSQESVIIETPCSDPNVKKNHLIPYMSCVVPEIMNTEIEQIKIWNLFIMMLALFYAFTAPYCVVFDKSSKWEYYVCSTLRFFSGGISFLYAVDVFVEIIGACPVAGYYYQFWDGLGVVSRQPAFMLDVLAALPLDMLSHQHQDIFEIVGTLFKVMKLWKVIRFLHYMDNVHPLKLFWFRLTQTIIVLLYGIHFIACISYNLACEYDPVWKANKCRQTAWLASYQIRHKIESPTAPIPADLQMTRLAYGHGYSYSFFYSAATLTSAGFGDFTPQTKKEMLWSIAFELFGFFLIGYYTSVLTSALSCVVRPMLTLQQQLVSMHQFMNQYYLRESLKDKIIEYFVLQHQLRGGASLEGNELHLMYDAPDYLRDDILYLEVAELLDGVPIFSVQNRMIKVDPEVIIELGSKMKRFIIPANTTFVLRGEVRRILYLIKHGSMGVYEDGCDDPIYVLEPSCHFGVRDLLFGEPSHYILRSLSQVSMCAISNHVLESALQTNEDEFWELVNYERHRIKEVIHEMTTIYSTMEKYSGDIDKALKVPSWIVIPPPVPATAKKVLGKVESERLARIKLLNDEYDEPFKVKRTSIFKHFLLRKTVHPVGSFSKIWNCVMSIACCLTVICLLLKTFCYFRMPYFRVFQWLLDWTNYVDIYLKLHWSYYNPHNGILVTHPLKTAMQYILYGSLVLDVAIVAPIELTIWGLGLTNFLGYGKSSSWYSRFRWVRFFQFKRIPMVFKVVHKVFKHRGIILLTLYITMTLFVCTMVSAIATYIACPWEGNKWTEGDENRLPVCLKGSWASTKYSDVDTNPAVVSGILRRWILGLYYVSQVILVIGFGDMITLGKPDIILLVLMCVFGFIFMRVMIADMTAAEVDSDETRANFVENLVVLNQVMKREKIPRKIYETVFSHLRYTWSRSKGLQARELFGELHPVLEAELYRNLIGDNMKKVPIFDFASPTVLRSICSYMKKQYILTGERIMRYGNLEYEMCIITVGKVYIADQHLNYVCTLGPGDSFGESSMIYGTQRRFNAIAACNTEIILLSSFHFARFLERYPNFKKEMKKNLAAGNRDYFERILDDRMMKAKELSPEKKNALLLTYSKRSSIIRDLVQLKEDFAQSGLDMTDVEEKHQSKILGCGTMDYDLPLFYFAQQPSKNKRCSSWYPVIHPNCVFARYFMILITWLCFFTPAICVYELCFTWEFLSSENVSGKQSERFFVSRMLHLMSTSMEYTFLVNMCLQFCMAFEVTPGIYNKTPYCIVVRYLTALDSFLVDFIASSPFLLELSLGVIHGKFPKVYALLQPMLGAMFLLRIIRLYHYYKYQTSKKDDLDISTFRYKITLSVTSFCLMAHFLACFFFWISPCTRPDLKNTTFTFYNFCPPPKEGLDRSAWTTAYVIEKGIETDPLLLEQWRWYFRSLYWVVTTISTTGFGEIVPVNINEMVVGIICIFCGAFILSIILSQFTSGMGSLTRTKREYMYQVLLLVKHLKNIGLSANRQSQVMMYFLAMWERCRGVPYHKTWKSLPMSMQIEFAYSLFGSTLNKVPFFRDSKEKIFIRQLSIRATHSFYIPGTYIQKDGDKGSTLFVVYKGIVSGTQASTSGEPHLKSIYNPGDAFGKFAAFFHDGTYKKAYRAETMAEILEIKQNDIVHLSGKFPRFKSIIEHFLQSRYTPGGSNTNIFQPKRKRAHVFGVGTELTFVHVAKRIDRLNPHHHRVHKRIHVPKRKVGTNPLWEPSRQTNRLSEVLADRENLKTILRPQPQKHSAVPNNKPTKPEPRVSDQELDFKSKRYSDPSNTKKKRRSSGDKHHKHSPMEKTKPNEPEPRPRVSDEQFDFTNKRYSDPSSAKKKRRSSGDKHHKHSAMEKTKPNEPEPGPRPRVSDEELDFINPSTTKKKRRSSGDKHYKHSAMEKTKPTLPEPESRPRVSDDQLDFTNKRYSEPPTKPDTRPRFSDEDLDFTNKLHSDPSTTKKKRRSSGDKHHKHSAMPHTKPNEPEPETRPRVSDEQLDLTNKRYSDPATKPESRLRVSDDQLDFTNKRYSDYPTKPEPQPRFSDEELDFTNKRYSDPSNANKKRRSSGDKRRKDSAILHTKPTEPEPESPRGSDEELDFKSKRYSDPSKKKKKRRSSDERRKRRSSDERRKRRSSDERRKRRSSDERRKRRSSDERRRRRSSDENRRSSDERRRKDSKGERGPWIYHYNL